MKNFSQFKDNRGLLTIFEGENVPFLYKRIFFIDSVPLNTERGYHAH